MPSQEGGSLKYRYFQQQLPFVFLPPFVAEMPAAVRMQEESNCPNRMAGWLFLPRNACRTLYRCIGSQHCPAFLCMDGITTMCSLKKALQTLYFPPKQPPGQESILLLPISCTSSTGTVAKELPLTCCSSQELPV